MCVISVGSSRGVDSVNSQRALSAWGVNQCKIQNEQICALYCIYFAYVMFAKVSEKYIDENFILR